MRSESAGTALASNPAIRRRDIKMIAVLSVPLDPPVRKPTPVLPTAVPRVCPEPVLGNDRVFVNLGIDQNAPRVLVQENPPALSLPPPAANAAVRTQKRRYLVEFSTQACRSFYQDRDLRVAAAGERMSYSDGELLFTCKQEARTAVGATPLLPTTSAGSSR